MSLPLEGGGSRLRLTEGVVLLLASQRNLAVHIVGARCVRLRRCISCLVCIGATCGRSQIAPTGAGTSGWAGVRRSTSSVPSGQLPLKGKPWCMAMQKPPLCKGRWQPLAADGGSGSASCIAAQFGCAYCRGEVCSPAALHFLPVVHRCNVRAIADRPYRCMHKWQGGGAAFHLISPFGTASPQGEAITHGHANAFPLRGRWPLGRMRWKVAGNVCTFPPTSCAWRCVQPQFVIFFTKRMGKCCLPYCKIQGNWVKY